MNALKNNYFTMYAAVAVKNAPDCSDNTKIVKRRTLRNIEGRFATISLNCGQWLDYDVEIICWHGKYYFIILQNKS